MSEAHFGYTSFYEYVITILVLTILVPPLNKIWRTMLNWTSCELNQGLNFDVACQKILPVYWHVQNCQSFFVMTTDKPVFNSWTFYSIFNFKGKVFTWWKLKYLILNVHSTLNIQCFLWPPHSVGNSISSVCHP